jgi:nucleoside-diphosphate-sugar epimerase
VLIAVTGGNGFVGKRLVANALGRGFRVRSLSRHGRGPDLEGVETFCGTLGVDPPDRFIPFLEGVDAVIHCAGELTDTARMEATHVGGTRDLLAAAAGRVGHWVQLSSVGVYGPIRTGCVTEDYPLRPAGTYEVTKAAADELVLASAARGDLSATLLRPSIVFAEDMPNDSLRQMGRAIEKGLFFFVGRPGASANYVHADDVADALLFCAAEPQARGRIFNLSGWASMEAFVSGLANGLGCPVPRRRAPLWLVRPAARLLRFLPHFPLTPARVDAVTSRVRYSSARIEAAGFSIRNAPASAITAVAAGWRRR